MPPPPTGHPHRPNRVAPQLPDAAAHIIGSRGGQAVLQIPNKTPSSDGMQTQSPLSGNPLSSIDGVQDLVDKPSLLNSEEVVKTVMSSAAEKAKKRRMEEEMEREAQKERARKKADKLEAVMKAKEALNAQPTSSQPTVPEAPLPNSEELQEVSWDYYLLYYIHKI